jgi:hypothetical protein
MSQPSPNEPWKIEVNDRYQKLVGSVISLATGALVLPALFLKEILGISEKKALVDYIDWRVFWS